MSPPSPHLSLISYGLAGFLVTAAIGWNLGAPAETTAKNHPEPPSATRSSRPRQASRTPGLTAETARKLAIVRNAPNSTERMRATIDLANTLPLTEFEMWLGGGRFDIRGGAELMLFTALLRDRWMREDPEGLALWCMKDWFTRDASEVFASWAETEPLRALAMFKQHPNAYHEFITLAAIAKNHPDVALQRLCEIDAEGVVEYGDFGRKVNELIGTLASNSPAALENLIDSLKNPLKTQVDEALVAAALTKDFTGELKKLMERSDGLKVFGSVAPGIEGVSEKIFDELENLPPSWRGAASDLANYCIDDENAEKWWNADLAGIGFTTHQEQAIRTRALQAMATHHPEEALKLMAEFDFPPQEGDSDGSERRWVIIENALSGNPEETEKIIAGLTTDKDREIAAICMERMQVAAREDSVRETKTPEQWLEQAATGGSKVYFDFIETLGDWPESAISELSEQFQAMPDDEKQKVAPLLAECISIPRNISTISGEALRYLLAHPQAGDPVSKADRYFNSTITYTMNLAVYDPTAGGEWVQSLPDGKAKLWAQINLHSIWTNYDPEAADRWLKSLPAETQIEVKNLGKKPEN